MSPKYASVRLRLSSIYGPFHRPFSGIAGRETKPTARNFASRAEVLKDEKKSPHAPLGAAALMRGTCAHSISARTSNYADSAPSARCPGFSGPDAGFTPRHRHQVLAPPDTPLRSSACQPVGELFSSVSKYVRQFAESRNETGETAVAESMSCRRYRKQRTDQHGVRGLDSV